jgi:hypothetical protein
LWIIGIILLLAMTSHGRGCLSKGPMSEEQRQRAIEDYEPDPRR